MVHTCEGGRRRTLADDPHQVHDGIDAVQSLGERGGVPHAPLHVLHTIGGRAVAGRTMEEAAYR